MCLWTRDVVGLKYFLRSRVLLLSSSESSASVSLEVEGS